MPSIGLGQGLARSAVLGGFDFSALTSLPAGRRSSVAAAANAAAVTLGVTPQAVIDAAGRCPEWWDWRSNTFTDAAATVAAVQGNAIETFRGVRAGLLASQSNAALKPVLGAEGIVFESDQMISPSTGFPTGNSSIGFVAIIDFSQTQPSSFPTPFGYATDNSTRRVVPFLSSNLLTARIGLNSLTYPSVTYLGQIHRFYALLSIGTNNRFSRLNNTAEASIDINDAINLGGSIYFGYSPFFGGAFSGAIRQIAWTTSIADTRILNEFLKSLEGI